MNRFRMGNYEMQKDQVAKDTGKADCESPASQEKHVTLAGNTALGESEAQRNGLGGRKEGQVAVAGSTKSSAQLRWKFPEEG